MPHSFKFFSFKFFSFKLFLLLFAAVFLHLGQATAQEAEPIAYTGHGAFFDGKGNQIVPTEDFVRKALAWYRADLVARIPSDKRERFDGQYKIADSQLSLTGREKLMFESRTIDWLMENATRQPDDARKQGKLSALRYALQFELPKNADDIYGAYVKHAPLRPELLDQFQKFGFGTDKIGVFKSTVNFGKAYIDECSNNNVPIPPAIGILDPNGLTGWKSQGFIPSGTVPAGSTNELFLPNTVVEVMTYHSSSPEGVCIALPRSNDPAGNQIVLDGVICLGKTPSPISAKSSVCFWDNQMNGTSFPYTKGLQIPIGWTDPAVQPPLNNQGLFMSGGAQLTSIGAGMCTDCHAGRNPFIVHPANPSPQKPFGQAQNAVAPSTLGKLSKAPLNLPMMGDTWYDPIVAATWPQNKKMLNDVYLPQKCTGCHDTDSIGRLPHLSTDLPGYCGTVLKKAVSVGTPHSMPQFDPGSASADADLATLINLANPIADPATFCGMGPLAGPANRGDPHITTTNNVPFDFQSAGEFTALREQDRQFELQTRQTPVLTNFVPGTNPYTGLAVCVSINTAVALQMGKHRVTYQQPSPTQRRIELRIDGVLTSIPNGSVALGQGYSITSNGADAFTFNMADQSKIIVTPIFWASQGYWYMDVEVIKTSAIAGIMGHIAKGEWLPRGGDRTNFGSKPAFVADRFNLLYRKFADSWRVTDTTSLFDYPSGLTTKDFTDTNWPSEQLNCQASSVAGPKVKQRISTEEAVRLCLPIKDKALNTECVYDVMVTGEIGFAKLHQRSLKLRRAAQQ